MLRSVATICLLVGGADAFAARSGPIAISRTRSSTAGALSMGLFNREPEDPWEAMKKRGEKELKSRDLNSERDDPYDKRNVGVGMRSAKYRTIDKQPQQQYTPDGRVINKRGPNTNVRASSQRQVSRAAVAAPKVNVAAGMGRGKKAAARPAVKVDNSLYKTTDKKNKFGNKSAGNLGNEQFMDISDQDEAGFLPDFIANFFYDKSVGGPQRDLESVIAVQLFFATFVLTPTGLYLGGFIDPTSEKFLF